MPALDRVVKSKVVAPSMVLIPADLVSIAVVRAAICEALNDHGWDQDDCRRVVLAASEAVANAVEHGSQGGELVEIVYQVGDMDAQLRILDSGGPEEWTPPAEPPVPSPDAPRGRGLALIRALAQKVEFRSAGRGTELRLDFARGA